MRKRFEQQLIIGATPISETKFPLRSRDELPPVLKALHYIFITPELNNAVFNLLEDRITNKKKKTGRTGMDLWQILVLATVRHTLDTNWDRLEHVANYDNLVRQILGVYTSDYGVLGFEFGYQTIIDNVSLIDEELLFEINDIVVKHGQLLLKKREKEELELRLKTDSFALKTNVHFPTDLNLLWDSVRKCFDMIKIIQEQDSTLIGWRKIKELRKLFKAQFRSTSQQVFKGKNAEQKMASVKAYLALASQMQKRFSEVLSAHASPSILLSLNSYNGYVAKFIDQIERRLLKNEVIPSEEKMYSIFEQHTEWLNKGKSNPSVELGLNILITTDQHHFIVDYKVMKGEKDAAQISPLCVRLAEKYPANKIESHSFDKGFYSKENYATLVAFGIINVVMPKKGKLNKIEAEREGTKEFKKIRNKHSAVESNINMLEHHGLDRCPDKGYKNFNRYVGFSVLAYNLHIIGNHLIAKEKEKLKKELKRLERQQKQAA
ncbi:MAG: ISNCY family transposase [Bacteroidia bacterium]|nr:ISNCY family transposase [Bacteroidia bacterium]